MKFIFFGTDNFSITVLDELKRARFMPSLVVTVPDKPRGRGLKVLPSLAKQWAEEHKIPVAALTPDVEGFKHRVSASVVDLFIVASYGKMIPKAVLDISKYGALNVHPSLLPKYRGPSPIESQIINDEKEIGVTIMKMDEKMDHGPIVSSYQLPATSYQPMPKASELRKRLAEEGGRLLAETIPKWVLGEMTAVPQDESKATYTKKFIKTDGEINLTGDAYQNFLKIRAFEDGIGTYFYMKKSTLSPSFSKGGARGGFSERHTRVIIKDAKFENRKLVITRVTPEGKKEMDYKVGFSAGSGATG